MRGDRPWEYGGRKPSAPATPHARGSTPNFLYASCCGTGYPACAGIDLRLWDGYSATTGLPRMRGDRPQTIVGPFQIPMATPHARGSTRLHKFPGEGFGGYPACAGIDPQ